MESLVLLLVLLLALVEGHTPEEWKSRVIYQVLTDRFNNPKGGSCNVSKYCGGTFRGIIDKLDYIQDLGFNAIWISPVVENTDGGYHGYWAKNLYNINSHFGTEDDLYDLVEECHSRGIWVMVDVVGNHMGSCVGKWNYSCLYPFNKSEYFHNYDCEINNWNNQTEVENCRLSGLPDLNQEVSFVANTLYDWVDDLVTEYDFDGVRIDTLPEVPKWFWQKFADSAGVYSLGECFNGNIDYVSSYQGYVDGVFNYPLYYTLGDVFGRQKSCWTLSDYILSMNEKFQDTTLLGTFVDNHDNPRWLNQFGNDHVRFKNALTFALTFQGIPVIYYGSEQGFNGGADPNNREALWLSNFSTSSDLYSHIKTLTRMRVHNYKNWSTSKFQERYVLDDLYCFSRGNVFVTISNYGNNQGNKNWYISNTPYSSGTTVCNIFWPSDCVTVMSNGQFQVSLNNGESKVFVPKADINNYLG